jgi:hypothetical protein
MTSQSDWLPMMMATGFLLAIFSIAPLAQESAGL